MKQQKSGSVLCYGCNQLVSVNSRKCIHCGTSHPGLWGYAKSFRRLGSDFGFIRIVIFGCVGLYLLSLLVSLVLIAVALKYDSQNIPSLGFLTPLPFVLLCFGATGSVPIFEGGLWWTTLSAGWLHLDLLHILFNLLWFRLLAVQVANAYGAGRLVIIYTISIVTGGALSSAVGQITWFAQLLPSLPVALRGALLAAGASGGIFGLLGALVTYGQRYREFEIKQRAIALAFIFFISGLIPGSGVDNWGHLGGFLGGYLFTQTSFIDSGHSQKMHHVFFALACLALTAVSIFASIVYSIFSFSEILYLLKVIDNTFSKAV